MLEVNVQSVNGQQIVKLNNATELNAKTAKAAAEIAFGVTAHCTVSNESATYRVTKSVRKIN